METGHRAGKRGDSPPANRGLELAEILADLKAGRIEVAAQALHDLGRAESEFAESERGGERAPLRAEGGRYRKVSVSMPEDLSSAVQERVGRGEFSRYVTEAVSSRLEADLLAELIALLEDEFEPVSEDLVTEAEQAWPDAE